MPLFLNLTFTLASCSPFPSSLCRYLWQVMLTFDNVKDYTILPSPYNKPKDFQLYFNTGRTQRIIKRWLQAKIFGFRLEFAVSYRHHICVFLCAVNCTETMSQLHHHSQSFRIFHVGLVSFLSSFRGWFEAAHLKVLNTS